MQQKHKGRQPTKELTGKRTSVKPRTQATRGRPTSQIRSLPSQQQSSPKPTPQPQQRHASYVKETAASPKMEFRRCDLIGPDGHRRPGWELWVGDMMFGRADTQETLLAYHSRLHDPIPSGHWKDRAWQPMKKKSPGRPKKEKQGVPVDDDEAEFEEADESSWVD